MLCEEPRLVAEWEYAGIDGDGAQGNTNFFFRLSKSRDEKPSTEKTQ